MAEKEVMEMISAYASGCMDQENFKNFKDYLDSGGELPKRDLGELQNVISLIPVILEPEKPDPSLKSKVAKNLLAHQSEIKAKLKEQKHRKTQIEQKEEPAPTIVNIDHSPKETKDEFNNFGRNAYVTKEEVEGESIPRKRKTIYEKIDERSYQSEAAKPPIITKGSLISIIILGIVLVTLWYWSDSKIAEIEKSNETMDQQISSLREDVNRANDFIFSYRNLLEFIGNSNISVIELEAGAEQQNYSGKLLIAFEDGEGLLQLNNLPVPEGEQIYQLWMVTNGQSYSLGTFVPDSKKKYLRFAGMPYVPRDEINLFRLTLEERKGLEIPKGQTVLFGSLKK